MTDTNISKNIPFAIPTAQPISHTPLQKMYGSTQKMYGSTMVIDSNAHSAIHYCRSCGKKFQPQYNHKYTAQFFRCTECTGSKGFLFSKTLLHSCIVM